MYAIFQAKGKQFRADPEGTLRLPLLEAEPGDKVTFDEVLLGEREGRIVVGQPALQGASVVVEVVRHGKDDKIIVYKMKRRKGYRRKQGHRQDFTEILVREIELGSGKSAKPKAKADAEKAPKAEKAEKAGRSRRKRPRWRGPPRLRTPLASWPRSAASTSRLSRGRGRMAGSSRATSTRRSKR